MPAFEPLFVRSDVQYVDDLTVALPDPTHAPGDLIIRPGVARYGSRTLVLLHVTPSSSAFDLRSPVTGTVRQVDLPGMMIGTSQLLEISGGKHIDDAQVLHQEIRHRGFHIRGAFQAVYLA